MASLEEWVERLRPQYMREEVWTPESEWGYGTGDGYTNAAGQWARRSQDTNALMAAAQAAMAEEGRQAGVQSGKQMVPQEVLDYFKGYTPGTGSTPLYTDSQGYQWAALGDGGGIWGASHGDQPGGYDQFLRGDEPGRKFNEVGSLSSYFDRNGVFTSQQKSTRAASYGELAAQLIGAVAGIGMVGAAAGVPLGTAGGAAGAVGSGAGFIGEGAASGIGAWDGALAASPSWSAGAAGAAGAAGGAASGGGTAAGGGYLSQIGKALGGLGGGGMSWTSLIGPALQLVGGAYTASQAGNAADAQVGAAREGIEENRRQFDVVRQLLAPYVAAGTSSLGSYMNLSGAGGAAAQQAEINALQGSPQFGSLVRQGEEAILQNASATGGLRGGNTQGALANYRTDVLSSLIDKQLGRYGGLIDAGQASAAGVGKAAQFTGQQVAGLQQQAGAAQAGGILRGSRAVVDAVGGVGGFLAARGSAPAAAPASLPSYDFNNWGQGSAAGGAGFGSGMVFGNQPLRSF